MPKDTLNQAAEIITSVFRGSVPEFPDDGISKELIGSNIASLTTASIIRQLSELAAKDDTFKSIELDELSIDQDNISMSVIFNSKLNDVLTQDINLNG